MPQAGGRSQMILEYLTDHVGHPLAAGVVEPCLPFARCVGNDNDVPASPLQLMDGRKFISVVEEEKVFSNDRALPILPHAVRGEMGGVFHEFTHIIPREDQ